MRITLRLVVGVLFVATALAGSASIGGAASTAAPTFGQYIVVLREGTDSAAIAAKHHGKYGAEISQIYKHALKGYSAKLSQSSLAGIEADADVLFVSPDHEVVADAKDPFPPPPNPQPAQVLSYGIDRIDGELSSARSGDGVGTVEGVNVAVLDSGVDTSHPDLNVAGGVNCGTGNAGFEDQYGHGTFVAGQIGALDNSIGRVGVAPGGRLWAVRVLDKNGAGSLSNEICGIDWVTSTRTDADPTNDIAVANMSLGGPVGHAPDDDNCGQTTKSAEHLAICRSVAAGIVYVASAGNDSMDFQSLGPATYREVLTATAIADSDGQPGGLGPTDSCYAYPDDTPAGFSNFATLTADQAHTVAAPGVCLGSTWPRSNYAVWSGTSFAAPLAAGTVALCIYSGACAGLTPAQIIQKIVTDAAEYNNRRKNSGYGFQGDPLRPISDKYYGYLIRAGLY